MSKLTELPNIGKITENLLMEVGINTSEDLIKIGSKKAFLKIREIDPTACIHMLYGLEGAVEGIKDKFLSEEIKEELKAFFNSL